MIQNFFIINQFVVIFRVLARHNEFVATIQKKEMVW